MTTLSVDLASRSYRDIGLVALESSEGGISSTPISLESFGLKGSPSAPILADLLASIAADRMARSILIDGPQAWKAPDNGWVHSRCCEGELATQGKTGLPGQTKPSSFLSFAEFSIALFDDLAERGFPRLSESRKESARVSVEVYPTSAWRALGISPLPSKRRATGRDIADRLRALEDLLGLKVWGPLTHDELQALVGGLSGICLMEKPNPELSLAGIEPFLLEGKWREGFILNPSQDASPGLTAPPRR